jgi:hypothetical protein
VLWEPAVSAVGLSLEQAATATVAVAMIDAQNDRRDITGPS